MLKFLLISWLTIILVGLLVILHRRSGIRGVHVRLGRRQRILLLLRNRRTAAADPLLFHRRSALTRLRTWIIEKTVRPRGGGGRIWRHRRLHVRLIFFVVIGKEVAFRVRNRTSVKNISGRSWILLIKKSG